MTGIFPWQDDVLALPPCSTPTMKPRRFVWRPRFRRNGYGALSMRWGRRVYLIWWARS